MRSCSGEWKCGGAEQDCGTERFAETENERVEAFWKDKLETEKYFLIRKGKKVAFWAHNLLRIGPFWLSSGRLLIKLSS